MPKIEFIDDEPSLNATNVDLTVDGWVVAYITGTTENNHRYIPRNRVKQIITTDPDKIEEPAKS